mgnify:CR=1 FL=1
MEGYREGIPGLFPGVYGGWLFLFSATSLLIAWILSCISGDNLDHISEWILKDWRSGAAEKDLYALNTDDSRY